MVPPVVIRKRWPVLETPAWILSRYVARYVSSWSAAADNQRISLRIHRFRMGSAVAKPGILGTLAVPAPSRPLAMAGDQVSPRAELGLPSRRLNRIAALRGAITTPAVQPCALARSGTTGEVGDGWLIRTLESCGTHRLKPSA